MEAEGRDDARACRCARRGKAPIAKPDTAMTTVDTPVTIPVTSNDSRRIVRKTVRIVSVPGQGTAANPRDGTVIYRPNPGFSGQDTFEYRVKDKRRGWSKKTLVQVTVLPGPQPPPVADVPPPVITSLQEDNGPNPSDNITNDNTPTLSGTASTSIIEVTLYQNGTPVPPAVPVINGVWSYTTVVLANGDYTFTATGKNAAGQESSPSAARIVMVRKNNGPTSPSMNSQEGCVVSESDLPGLVPPARVTDNPCLVINDDAIPVRVVVQQVDPDNNNKIGPIHTYLVIRDGILRIVIPREDPLSVGLYHLTFFVSDVAGNESCTESFPFVGENTGCAASAPDNCQGFCLTVNPPTGARCRFRPPTMPVLTTLTYTDAKYSEMASTPRRAWTPSRPASRSTSCGGAGARISWSPRWPGTTAPPGVEPAAAARLGPTSSRSPR